MFMRYFDPKKIPKDVLIKAGVGSLSVIKIEQQEDSIPLNCLNNTKKYISKHGGEIQFCWILTILGNLYLQLTAHAVVRQEDNSLLCVTLDENRKGIVNFAPDYSIEGLMRNDFLPTKFIALVNDHTVDNYLNLLRLRDELKLDGATLSSTEFKQVNSNIQELSMQLSSIAKKYTNRNDCCYCGSREKAKKCCC